MIMRRVTVNSLHYDLTPRRSWSADLVRSALPEIELLGRFEADVSHPDLGLIEAGTVSREYYFADRWFNYFVFFKTDGSIRNYYFNVCLPPKIGDGIIEYVDLDLDLVVWPDGETEILDEDEFRVNLERYSYPEPTQRKATETIAFLQTNWTTIVGETLPFETRS